jgi:hypothetical protein
MRFNFYKKIFPRKSKKYFCPEPWTGIFSVETNMNVTFCPCYLKMNIGNLKQSTLKEIWNSEKLVALRKDFQLGNLPEVCKGQLCAVALGDPSRSMNDLSLSERFTFHLRSFLRLS